MKADASTERLAAPVTRAANVKVTGTIRRITRFARPYRRWLIAFLMLIIVDALVSAAGPLIYKAIIDDGIIKKRSGFVVAMVALLVLHMLLA